jgi:DNA-binding CsgD family transcriptional regulator
MNGTPWPCGALTDRLDYEKKINPAIAEIAQADLVMHGLRGHACVRLRRAGCTAMQIADMIGMSVGMVERYCRLSVQKENAVAAVIQLRGTITERNGENVVKISER